MKQKVGKFQWSADCIDTFVETKLPKCLESCSMGAENRGYSVTNLWLRRRKYECFTRSWYWQRAVSSAHSSLVLSTNVNQSKVYRLITADGHGSCHLEIRCEGLKIVLLPVILSAQTTFSHVVCKVLEHLKHEKTFLLNIIINVIGRYRQVLIQLAF